MTKIDIISGFLGAGKTTLIKKLLDESFKGEKIVLIENEFGEIGIDGGFLKDAGVEITEMNSGCICCSLVGDFGAALKQVLADYSPARIVIEPSGVGKLSDVIHAVQNVASDDVVLNGFTTVVDAAKAKMYMKNFGEFFNNQVENAACIILSRTGGISDDKLDAAVALLREKNPEAVIITTPWEDLSGKTILEAVERKSTLKDTLVHMVSEAVEDDVCPVCGGHHHDHEHEHEHHHHHDHDEHCDCGHDHHDHGHHHHHGHDADEVFMSWGAETFRKYGEEDLRAMLNAFVDNEDYGLVLRAKGYVPAADGGQWVYFDYTPGELNVRRGAADVTGRVCVIGSKLKEEKLKELFRIG